MTPATQEPVIREVVPPGAAEFTGPMAASAADEFRRPQNRGIGGVLLDRHHAPLLWHGSACRRPDGPPLWSVRRAPMP
jgi:hypothetical protein